MDKSYLGTYVQCSLEAGYTVTSDKGNRTGRVETFSDRILIVACLFKTSTRSNKCTKNARVRKEVKVIGQPSGVIEVLSSKPNLNVRAVFSDDSGAFESTENC